MAGPNEAPFAFMMGCFAIFIMILLPVIDIIDGANTCSTEAQKN